MKFYIHRTSDIFNTNKPCKNAIENSASVDEGDMYYIDIKTMSELMKLIDECGHPLIIKKDSFLSNARGETVYSIEIYDDWRE